MGRKAGAGGPPAGLREESRPLEPGCSSLGEPPQQRLPSEAGVQLTDGSETIGGSIVTASVTMRSSSAEAKSLKSST